MKKGKFTKLPFENLTHVSHRIEPRDYFSERITEGEIDPRVASIPTKLDEAAEQLVYKHILDNARSVYQVTFKDPRES